MRLCANMILLAMAFQSLWHRQMLIVVMYLARSALANAPYPVRSSCAERLGPPSSI